MTPQYDLPWPMAHLVLRAGAFESTSAATVDVRAWLITSLLKVLKQRHQTSAMSSILGRQVICACLILHTQLQKYIVYTTNLHEPISVAVTFWLFLKSIFRGVEPEMVKKRARL